MITVLPRHVITYLNKRQAYYLQAPFPVEKAPTEAISKANDMITTGIVISQLLEYPVRGFVLEGGKTLKDLSDAVASACIRLQNTNFPFNVLISGCGKKVFLFPQVRIINFGTSFDCGE